MSIFLTILKNCITHQNKTKEGGGLVYLLYSGCQEKFRIVLNYHSGLSIYK